MHAIAVGAVIATRPALFGFYILALTLYALLSCVLAPHVVLWRRIAAMKTL